MTRFALSTPLPNTDARATVRAWIYLLLGVVWVLLARSGPQQYIVQIKKHNFRTTRYTFCKNRSGTRRFKQLYTFLGLERLHSTLYHTFSNLQYQVTKIVERYGRCSTTWLVAHRSKQRCRKHNYAIGVWAPSTPTSQCYWCCSPHRSWSEHRRTCTSARVHFGLS